MAFDVLTIGSKFIPVAVYAEELGAMGAALPASDDVSVRLVEAPKFGAASFGVERTHVIPKKIDPALPSRAARLARERRSENPLLTAASGAVARQVGGGHESVLPVGAPSRSRRREDVAILRAAMGFFVGEIDP